MLGLWRTSLANIDDHLVQGETLRLVHGDCPWQVGDVSMSLLRRTSSGEEE